MVDLYDYLKWNEFRWFLDSNVNLVVVLFLYYMGWMLGFWIFLSLVILNEFAYAARINKIRVRLGLR